MSLVTKIFVGLVVVLSFVLLGVSATLYGLRTDYRQRFEDTKAAFEKASKDWDGEKAAIQGNLDAAHKESDTNKQHAADLEGKLAGAEHKEKEVQQKFDNLMGEYNKLNDSVNSLKGDVNKFAEANTALSAQVTEITKAKDEATQAKDAAEAKLHERENELGILKTESAELQKRYEEQAREMSYYKQVAEQARAAGFSLAEAGATPKNVTGKILAVSSNTNLVIINVGKGTGVEAGMTFTVFRNDKFVGKVIVDKVESDMASATWLDEFKRDQI